jgi:hypothetical protein
MFMPSRSKPQCWILGMVVFFVGIIDLTALAVSIKVSQAYNNTDGEVLVLPDDSSTSAFAPVKAVRAGNGLSFDSANRQTLAGAASSTKSAHTVPAADNSSIAIAGAVLLALSVVMRHLTRSHGSK